MLQLKILSGKKAGTEWVARRFPIWVGRASRCDLQLEEDGVWDQHLFLELNPAEGFVLNAQPNALTRLNGEPVERAVLLNGDTLLLGSVELQCWLAETRQTGLRVREALTWCAIGAVLLAQLGLLWWLVRL